MGLRKRLRKQNPEKSHSTSLQSIDQSKLGSVQAGSQQFELRSIAQMSSWQALFTKIRPNNHQNFSTSKFPTTQPPGPEKPSMQAPAFYTVNSQHLETAMKKYRVKEGNPSIKAPIAQYKKRKNTTQPQPESLVEFEIGSYDSFKSWSNDQTNEIGDITIPKTLAFKKYDNSLMSLSSSVLDDGVSIFDRNNKNRFFRGNSAFVLSKKDARKTFNVKKASLCFSQVDKNPKFESSSGKYYHKMANPIFLKKHHLLIYK